VAKTSLKIKAAGPQKFAVRSYNRCKLCGRPHAYMRQFGICRHCFRKMAHEGQIPGVRKASW
jgi:small subunit ribosomal protein S14